MAIEWWNHGLHVFCVAYRCLAPDEPQRIAKAAALPANIAVFTDYRLIHIKHECEHNCLHHRAITNASQARVSLHKQVQVRMYLNTLRHTY
ncbi:MAG: hypothetical protein ACI9OO_000067 [Bacteroidia bacterium]|jgi:hypothetical protein